MDKVIKKYMIEHSDTLLEAYIAAYIKKNAKKHFPDIDKNLCLEHYNILHKSNFTESDLELNQSECWVCKLIKDKDRP